MVSGSILEKQEKAIKFSNFWTKAIALFPVKTLARVIKKVYNKQTSYLYQYVDLTLAILELVNHHKLIPVIWTFNFGFYSNAHGRMYDLIRRF